MLHDRHQPVDDAEIVDFEGLAKVADDESLPGVEM